MLSKTFIVEHGMKERHEEIGIECNSDPFLRCLMKA
jgi:hypothetical protein